jgi:hypothetical protein
VRRGRREAEPMRTGTAIVIALLLVAIVVAAGLNLALHR